MTSIRQIEANRRNASRSTGPRTPGGKVRSRSNAQKHGLAARVEDDREARERIDGLSTLLAEGRDDFERVAQSQVVAVCHFDLRRIAAARHDAFLTVHNIENATSNDIELAVLQIDRISRYEKRALSKLKLALRKWSA
jgi:hypothetical protein